MLSLVSTKFRFGSGKRVLRQLDADINDEVGLGWQGNAEEKSGDEEAPRPLNAHPLMMNETVGSCKRQNSLQPEARCSGNRAVLPIGMGQDAHHFLKDRDLETQNRTDVHQ